MAQKNDKYQMFKNYMLNELDITKEDIRAWIKESCKQIATEMVEQAHGKFSIEETVKKLVIEQPDFFSERRLKPEIVRLISEQIADKFSVSLNCS